MVRKNWVSVGVLGLGLSMIAPAFAQSKDTCKFEVRTRSKVGFRGTAKYFIKGDWVRQEKRSGGGLELIMVSNDKGMFIRNKHVKYWFKYPEGLNHDLKDRLLGGPIGDVPTFLKKVKAKPVGQDKIKNDVCKIWAYKYPRVADRFRLWISAKSGKPVQLERDYIVRATHKRDILVIEYRDYVANAAIPDTEFRVPAKERIFDMSKSLAASMGMTQSASKPARTAHPGQTSPLESPPKK
jgi:outer membrane lipoprotein-sorting protein